jgi:SAM-dependent methyltransferase
VHAAAFDQLAAEYDADFTDTPLGNALRGIVWLRMDHAFAGARRVLDLGCGTGEDAVRLASRGTRVVAVDASADMVRVAAEKVRRRACGDRVQFHCLPMERLGEVLDGQSFDGTLSNFGALNCVADLPALARDVAMRLEPGAHLVWVLMGRYVPWEWAWFLARADTKRAWRRMRGNVLWRDLTIRYPRPREVEAVLKPFFRIDSVRPLGFALPPSYAAGWLNRHPRALAALNRIEGMGHALSSLASCADHYIVEATRLEGSVS